MTRAFADWLGAFSVTAFGVAAGILMAVGLFYWMQKKKTDGDRLNDADWWKKG